MNLSAQFVASTSDRMRLEFCMVDCFSLVCHARKGEKLAARPSYVVSKLSDSATGSQKLLNATACGAASNRKLNAKLF